jgi:DNA-binding transcriptional MerR regulator
MGIEEISRKRRLQTRSLCERYDVCGRTIDRWVEQGILPPPLIINRRRYWDEAEIEQRERDGMKPSAAEAAA